MATADPKRNESKNDLLDEMRKKHGDGIASVVERFIRGDIQEKPRRYYEPTEE